MDDSFHASLMTAVAIAAAVVLILVRKNNKISFIIGFISWIALSLYFVIEAFVIRAATAPYSFLKQPMSDLGVTICGIETYPLAFYEICSPYHWLMNWTFFLTGLLIFAGAVLLHPLWPQSRASTVSTVCISIFGISYLMSGIFPANIHFNWHTLSALPGMIVQIPAMFLIGKMMHQKMPQLKWWSLFCGVVSIASLFILFLQPFVENIPGGLFQRLLYGTAYWWLTITAIMLWRGYKY